MLTVLLATYNGAATLPQTLEAFCQLQGPPGNWKLVIVNNGSTDQTEHIIRSYSQKLPLTLLYEPTKGKNAAINTGLNHIQGDLIVFTDDDVIPQPDWLIQLRLAADTYPEISIFGGAILPKWSAIPETWLLHLEWPYIGVSFALVEPTLAAGPTQPDYIVGPNMAIRADIFQVGYRFDVTIGPDGSNNYPMGSETELIDRLHKMGFKLWHCQDAIVYHIIKAHQMEREWVLQRATRFGRGKYSIWAKHALKGPLMISMSKYFICQAIIWTQLFAQFIRLTKSRCAGDVEKIFRQQWWCNYYLGKTIESWKIKWGQ